MAASFCDCQQAPVKHYGISHSTQKCEKQRKHQGTKPAEDREPGGAGSLGRLPHTIAHAAKAPDSLLLLPPAATSSAERIFPGEISAFACAATF